MKRSQSRSSGYNPTTNEMREEFIQRALREDGSLRKVIYLARVDRY